MAADGDEQELFCARAWPQLVAALTHYCGDVNLAEELVQDALVRACQRWRDVSALESPEGWAYRVAVNLANSSLRRRRAERRALQRHGPQPAVAAEADAADALAVRDVLGLLTAAQREVVILRYFLDMSAEQTARLVDSTPGAVRALTHRAVAALREHLDVSISEEVGDVS